jgi:hypothetical protein
MKSPWINLFSASLSLSLAGCCCGLVDLSDLLPTVEEGEPSADTPGVDLGVAAYPENTPESQATRYAWRDGNKEPAVYRVGYALSNDEQAAVDRAQNDLVERVNFHDRGGGKFSWTPPKGCGPHMQCIFEDLAEHSKPDIDPLVALRIRRAFDDVCPGHPLRDPRRSLVWALAACARRGAKEGRL